MGFILTSRGWRNLGNAHVALGVACVLVQIVVYVCALYPNDIGLEVYSKTYAQSIALSSTGLIAGVLYIIIGFCARRIANLLDQPTPTPTEKASTCFKILSALSLAVTLVMTIFSGYLAFLTSHWYLTDKVIVANVAHGALPMHVFHILFGVVDAGLAVYGLLSSAVSANLPPVSYRRKENQPGAIGVENPGYFTS